MDPDPEHWVELKIRIEGITLSKLQDIVWKKASIRKDST
jgi:hypothetical protein